MLHFYAAIKGLMDGLFTFNTQGHRRDWMMLGTYGVGPSVGNSFPEHISGSTCPIVLKFYTQHLKGVLLCLLGYMNFDLLLVQFYDSFRRFGTKQKQKLGYGGHLNFLLQNSLLLR